MYEYHYMNVLFFVIACSTAAPEVPRVVACLVVFGNAVFLRLPKKWESCSKRYFWSFVSYGTCDYFGYRHRMDEKIALSVWHFNFIQDASVGKLKVQKDVQAYLFTIKNAVNWKSSRTCVWVKNYGYRILCPARRRTSKTEDRRPKTEEIPIPDEYRCWRN